jgi:hypothetical protein
MAPSGEHRRVTIRVETEVELDVALMAKTFAHMNSGDQARFFALAHQQMATYSREEPDGSRFKMGSYGRETQMLSIKDHFHQQPDAREFILSLYQVTIEEDTFTDVSPVVEGSVTPIPCDECKGTGKWTNPFNDETTPCSRGCKP